MKSECAVYVDAGYLLASAATTITGTSLRSGITADYPALLETVSAEAERVAGVRVLRTQWYDAADNGVPSPRQEQIGMLPRVKLRLGRFGQDGQQKGVDLRIGLDMVGHARNAAVGTIVLVSGDDDLTVAVEEAQQQGVEVIILAVADKDGHPHGVAKHLRLAADAVAMLDAELISKAIRKKIKTSTVQSPRITENLPDRAIPGAPAAAAVVPPPEPSERVTPLPAGPTPASLGAQPRKYTPTPSSRRTRSEVAYTSTTGETSATSSWLANETKYEDEIATVAIKVVSSFLESATAEARAEVASHRPSILQELDRALLLDLADITDDYNLDDAVRRNLRAAFWEQVDIHLGNTEAPLGK